MNIFVLLSKNWKNIAAARKSMKIEHMLFSDGTVEEYDFHNDELKMLFRDSSESLLSLCFTGSIEARERGSIGLSVYESHLDQEGDTTKLRLLDDDLKEMLTIKFRQCQIE